MNTSATLIINAARTIFAVCFATLVVELFFNGKIPFINYNDSFLYVKSINLLINNFLILLFLFTCIVVLAALIKEIPVIVFIPMILFYLPVDPILNLITKSMKYTYIVPAFNFSIFLRVSS
jgi:hypothetical protein